MWKRITDIIIANFIKYQGNMRLGMIVNSFIVLLMGAGIGALCACLVLTMNDVLLPPWSYLLAFAAPFLAKTGIMWLGTLAVVPFIGHMTSRIFRIQTGITLQKHQWPSINLTGNRFTIPVAAAIAVTIYLSGLGASGKSAITAPFIYYIAVSVGGVVALTESLSDPTTIKAIWHNRADYQETRLYKQSRQKVVESNKSSSPNTNGHSSLTRAQERRAKRGRPASKR